MSDFQEEVLRESEFKQNVFTKNNKEGNKVEITSGEGGAFLNFEKDASIIVWPDGSYGKEGFEKYVTIDKRGGNNDILSKINGKVVKKFNTFTLKNIAKPVIDNLAKYSIKYHEIIETLRKVTITGGKVFIFCTGIG